MGSQLPLNGARPPVFGSCVLWPNGWMDEDATWYGSRPRPRPHCIRRGSSCPRKGHSSFPLFCLCVLWPRSPVSAIYRWVLVLLCFCVTDVERKKLCLCRRESTVMDWLKIWHTRRTNSYILSREAPSECFACQTRPTVRHFLLEFPHLATQKGLNILLLPRSWNFLSKLMPRK